MVNRYRPVRVCLVTDYFPGAHSGISGAELVCVRLGEMLSQIGHEVTYLTSPFPTGYDRTKDVHIVDTPLMSRRFLSSNLPVDIWSYRSAMSLLQQLRPDVVHFVAKGLFPGVMLACIRLGIPTAFTVVDQYLVCPKENLRRSDGANCDTFHGFHCGGCMRYDSGGSMLRAFGGSGGGYLGSFVRARYVDWLARRLSAIVTMSDASKRRLVQYGLDHERIHTIYHYKIDIDRESPLVPFDEPTVLYAGTLTEERGPQVAIRSMAQVVARVPNAVLRLVGPDTPERPYRPQLESLVAELGISTNVLFLGGKANSDVIQLIRRSHVVIVPLQWPNEYGPVILVEAKCVGKPVVASRIGATPEFVEDGEDGFLVPFDQPEAFAERIVYLLQNADQARRIGERASESVAFLQGDASVKKIVDLYRSLAVTEKRPAI